MNNSLNFLIYDRFTITACESSDSTREIGVMVAYIVFFIHISTLYDVVRVYDFPLVEMS